MKKHDKQTGFTTRAQFMRVCVSPQPLTHYPRLLVMIKEAEEFYREISSAAATARLPSSDKEPTEGDDAPLEATEVRWAQSPHRSRLLGRGSDETDFIEAILNLRSEVTPLFENLTTKQAVRMRDTEDADIVTVSPETGPIPPDENKDPSEQQKIKRAKSNC